MMASGGRGGRRRGWLERRIRDLGGGLIVFLVEAAWLAIAVLVALAIAAVVLAF